MVLCMFSLNGSVDGMCMVFGVVSFVSMVLVVCFFWLSGNWLMVVRWKNLLSLWLLMLMIDSFFGMLKLRLWVVSRVLMVILFDVVNMVVGWGFGCLSSCFVVW